MVLSHVAVAKHMLTLLVYRRPGDVSLQKRVQADLAALQLRQRDALNEVTSAAASPSNLLRPPRGEETADTRPRSDRVRRRYSFFTFLSATAWTQQLQMLSSIYHCSVL